MNLIAATRENVRAGDTLIPDDRFLYLEEGRPVVVRSDGEGLYVDAEQRYFLEGSIDYEDKETYMGFQKVLLDPSEQFFVRYGNGEETRMVSETSAKILASTYGGEVLPRSAKGTQDDNH